MGIEALLERLKREAVTPVTPTPAAAVTPEPPPRLECTPVTPVAPSNHERALVGERAKSGTASAPNNVVDGTLPYRVPVAEGVRCNGCRHFVQIEYPRLGRCARDQPAPERGGLFWGHDVRICAAFEEVPNWPAGPRPDSRSRLHAWLRLVSIETVVPLDELLAFYRDDFDSLAALSLDELRRTIADYKAHRSEYRRILAGYRGRPVRAEGDAAADQLVVTLAVA